MLHYYLISLFYGFALFILIHPLVYRKTSDSNRQTLREMLPVAIQVVRLTSIAFLVTWIFQIALSWNVDDERMALLNRMTGHYWPAYWLSVVVLGVLPQVFWFKWAAENARWRVLVSVAMLLLLMMEKIVIFVTSFHRDYVPSSWSMHPGGPDSLPVQIGITVLYLLMHLVAFVIVVFLIHYLTRKRRVA